MNFRKTKPANPEKLVGLQEKLKFYYLGSAPFRVV